MVEDKEEFERHKVRAIALCNRRIEAARYLFLDSEIDREDYLIRKEQNEREIAHWQVRTTETQEIALELAICLDAIYKMARLWNIADDEDRMGMAQNLFEEVVVNLDTRSIENFRRKLWADRFLVLRMELYRDEYPEIAKAVEADLAENETPAADEAPRCFSPWRSRWQFRIVASNSLNSPSPMALSPSANAMLKSVRGTKKVSW